MRIVFDALGATEKSGGMRLHCTEVIRAWTEVYPADDVCVVAGRWAETEFAQLGVKVVTWPNEGVVGRSIGQLFGSGIIALATRADFLVSLSPIVSILARRSTTICFQHDWRHKKNPHEFPLHQRVYRKLWERSAAHADVNVCISAKAAEETTTFSPGAKTVVIENGRDHARRWARTSPVGARAIVTFGHHNNKRPELVIDAFAQLPAEMRASLRLVVLGARASYAQELRDRARGAGVAEVEFPGFVRSDEYEALVSNASVIVMASSDEGFGLPIAEAQFFGIPAIITSDSGMAEIFGDYPLIAPPNAASLSAAILRSLESEATRRAKPERTEIWTWHNTVDKLRDTMSKSPRRGI